MKVIYGKRQTGKTTKLIKKASKNNYSLIVCHSRDECHRIFEEVSKINRSRKKQISIPFPITYQEFLNKQYCGQHIDSFLIDNVDMFLQSLTNVPIEAITINNNINT